MLLAGLAGLLFSPDRRPAARHLPRRRLARPGLHRPARAQHLDVGDRRLQRPRRAGLLAVRLLLRQHATPTSSSSACRSGEAERLWYLGLFLAIAAYLFATQPAAQPPGPRAHDAARQRGRRGGHGRRRAALQGARLPGLVDVRRPRRACCTRCPSAASRPESFALDLSILYLAMIVLGGLGSVGGAALGAVFVSALPIVFQEYADVAAVRLRGRAGRRVRRPGGPLPVRPGDRPRRPLRARRARRPRRPLPPRRGRRHAPSRRQHPRAPPRHPHQHKGAPHEARPPRGRSCSPPRRCSPPAAAAPRRPDTASSGGGGRRRAARSRPTAASRAAPSRSASSPTSPACSPRSAPTSPTPTRCSGRSRTPAPRSAARTPSSSTSRTPATCRPQGVQLYSGMKDEVLAMQQTIGSPINTALLRSTRPTTSSTSRRRGRAASPRCPGTGDARRDVRRRDGQRHRLRAGGGADQGGRHDRPHLLRGRVRRQRPRRARSTWPSSTTWSSSRRRSSRPTRT